MMCLPYSDENINQKKQMEFDRATNAKRAIVSGLLFKVISIIGPFLMRTLIIYTLGNLYLGLSSLFTSILNALNLAELGIGSALVFTMYRPVADDNKERVGALLNVYRLAYYAIGIIVLICGVAIVPFIPNMIHGEYPGEINIYYVYLIHLAATTSGYFFMGYRSSILQAYQRSDVINSVTIVMDLLTYSMQAIALIGFRNYYLYVLILLFRSVGINLVISFITHKKFGDIIPTGKISIQEKKQILQKTGALIGHKVGTVVVNSVDNILISAYIGLNIVAVYNNYFFIFTALSGMFLMLTNGLTSIIGNYIIQKDQSEINGLFNNIHIYLALTVCFCCTCLFTMFQPFISAWTGNNSLLPFSSVILFTLYFFIVKIKTVGLLFKDAAGLWEKDVLKPYIQIAIDLVIDLVLLRAIGINGAIISSIACMIFGFFYETIVVFRYCLKKSPNHYYFNTALYFFATVISCTVSMIICGVFSGESSVIKTLLHFIVSAFVSILVFAISTFWTKDFSHAVRYLRLKFRSR